jgi:peptidoglycan/LPS O-acetylase OafA/YrhL
MNPRPIIEFRYREDLLKGSLSPVLDHLRWISAMLVCAAHTRNLLFPNASAVPRISLNTKAFYFITLFGTEAVTVFFVISGLLVGGKVIFGAKAGSFSISHYAIDRLTRLYTVLIPAVFLSILLSPLSTTGKCPDAALRVIENLLFLQNVLAEPLCNNGPLWSLSNEAFYYLCAGLAALFIIGRHRVAAGVTGVLTLALLSITASMDHQNILIAAPIWCFGLIPWFVRIRLPYYIFGMLFLISLWLALCSDWKLTIPHGGWLAGFSYSLYLIHMPLAQAAAHFIPIQDPSTFGAYVIYSFVVCAIFGIAWLFGYFFEANTAALRKVVTRRLMGRP